jgi:hypothetical protein
VNGEWQISEKFDNRFQKTVLEAHSQ